MIEINFLSMSKPKTPLNMVNAKVPDISEICITYRLFKKLENGKTFSGRNNTENFNQSSKY